MVNYYLTKEARTYNRVKTVHSINGVGKIGQIDTCTRMKLDHLLSSATHKNKFKNGLKT